VSGSTDVSSYTPAEPAKNATIHLIYTGLEWSRRRAGAVAEVYEPKMASTVN